MHGELQLSDLIDVHLVRAVRQPQRARVRPGGGQERLLRSRGFDWDKSDRLRRLVDSLHGPIDYTHDALGNLAAATDADGAVELRLPDAVGNLFKREDRKDRKYGPAGQLLESVDASGALVHYAYDAEGNLIEKREGRRAWTYSWGPDGMLREVQRPDGRFVRFDYDALGRRLAKHYCGQVTRWVWDGNVPLHEWVEGVLEHPPRADDAYRPPSDAPARKREAELEALLAQGPPARGTAQEPITWLFEPGSFAPAPVLMASALGERVWSAVYSAFGELHALDGARHACPFRWPGQYEDLETGLYYNRFRYYDAESGQYTSQDPLRLWGGLELYSYPLDPLSFFDPLSGSRNKGSQFISTSTDPEALKQWREPGQTMVSFDTDDVVPDSKGNRRVLDISTKEKAMSNGVGSVSASMAAKSKEVLVEGHVPPQAIKVCK